MNPALFRRPAVRRAAAIKVALLGIAGILLSGIPAAAAVTPGTVLAATSATLPPELSPLATGKRVTYATTTVSGAATTATGLVLTPKTGKKNQTVVWGHGTTGLADKCTPSTNESVFWPEARAAVAALLAKGWTVAAPDYPGLGTTAAHPYLIGASEGRSMIDSVKAARNLDHSLSTKYVLDGHSQGGQGALFGGQLAPSYDGSLMLRGVAAIAPVSNVDVLAPLIPGTPGQGYLVMALYGLNTVEPAFNPNTVLAPPAQQQTPVLQSGCLYEILDAYDSMTPNQLLFNGTLPQSVVIKLGYYDNPGQSAPSAPILIVQGTEDEAVPYDVTAGLLLDELEAYDQSVDFIAVNGANHDGAVFATAGPVADWIESRFA